MKTFEEWDDLIACQEQIKYQADALERLTAERNTLQDSFAVSLLRVKELESERDALRADAERYQKGLNAVQELIDESSGVGGLHLNGDFAEWQELQTGGRFEGWLADFDAAIAGEKK